MNKLSKVLCLFVTLLMVMGCRSIKKSISEKETTSDSVRIEYKERIVKVPVMVEVEVPAEAKERVSRDSASHLETSFAVSDASMVWIDGVAFLRHSLSNKAQKIQKKDSVREAACVVAEGTDVVWCNRLDHLGDNCNQEQIVSFLQS